MKEKKNIIAALLQENDIQTVENTQDALKDFLDGTNHSIMFLKGIYRKDFNFKFQEMQYFMALRSGLENQGLKSFFRIL